MNIESCKSHASLFFLKFIMPVLAWHCTAQTKSKELKKNLHSIIQWDFKLLSP